MATKSVQRRLSDASDLAAVLKITNSELVCVNVYAWSEVSFQLHLKALGRVYRQLRIKRSALQIRTGEQGDFHFSFTAKGVTFCSCVIGEQARQWLEQLGHGSVERIEEVGEQLALPAPV